MISLFVAILVICAIITILRWLNPPVALLHGAYLLLTAILLLATLRAFGVEPRFYMFLGEPGPAELRLKGQPP